MDYLKIVNFYINGVQKLKKVKFFSKIFDQQNELQKFIIYIMNKINMLIFDNYLQIHNSQDFIFNKQTFKKNKD